MLHCNVRKQDRGFTLVELLAVVIIIGILAAVTMPSLFGLKRKNELKQALAQVESALKEGQKQAMRRSASCSIKITTQPIGSETKYVVTTANPTDLGCLSEVRILPSGVTSNIQDTITFSYKGNTTNAQTIILSANDVSEQRCLVISQGLGIMRSGLVNGVDCQTTQ
jgi:prepilin-type N-terminal cleavage/methylation domain-containing protein